VRRWEEDCHAVRSVLSGLSGLPARLLLSRPTAFGGTETALSGMRTSSQTRIALGGAVPTLYLIGR
jgi:hypothetical protein